MRPDMDTLDYGHIRLNKAGSENFFTGSLSVLRRNQTIIISFDASAYTLNIRPFRSD